MVGGVFTASVMSLCGEEEEVCMRIVRVTALVLSIVVLSYGSTASADLLNGGFEDGLYGWGTAGYVAAVDWEQRQDLEGGFWEPMGDDSHFFASLWSTSVNEAGELRSNAALVGSFTAPAGYVLSFDYFFDYGDYDQQYDPPQHDTAVATLSWYENGQPTSTKLFEHNRIIDQLDDFGNIEWTQMPPTVLPLADDDTYWLLFTINDMPLGTGPGYPSILGIDNVSVNVVPLPGAVLLGALGLGSAGGLLRRLRRGNTQ